MTVSKKNRNAGFIVNKTGESQRFQMFLQSLESNHTHFSTTLNQNPHELMGLYNMHQNDNASVTQEQEELGLTNSVKLGLATTLFLIGEEYIIPGFNSYDLVDKVIDFNLAKVREAGLRFITEDKAVCMAAAWYTWHNGGRTGNALRDLAERFYDVFWFFLEPTEQSKFVNFDRDDLFNYLESILPKTAKAMAPAMAPAQEVLPSIFKEEVQKTYEFFYHTNQKNFENPERFNAFVADGAIRYQKRKDHEAGGWMKSLAESGNRNAEVFADAEAMAALFSAVVMMPFYREQLFDAFTPAFAGSLMNDIDTFIRTNNFKLRKMQPGTFQDFTSLGVFMAWTSLNTGFRTLNELMVVPQTRRVKEIVLLSQIQIVAESLVHALGFFYEQEESSLSTDKDTVLENVVETVMFNIQMRLGEKLFSITPREFRSNRDSFIKSLTTKENTMSQANATPAAQSNASAAASIEDTLRGMFTELEQRQQTAMTEGFSEMQNKLITAADKALNKAVDKKFEEVIKRISSLENITGQTVDKDKLDETGQAALKGIMKAAKDAKEDGKKKKKSVKAAVTIGNLNDLSTTEKVVAGLGIAAVSGLVGYGVYKAVEMFLED